MNSRDGKAACKYTRGISGGKRSQWLRAAAAVSGNLAICTPDLYPHISSLSEESRTSGNDADDMLNRRRYTSGLSHCALPSAFWWFPPYNLHMTKHVQS